MKGNADGGFLISGLPFQFKENTSRRFICPEFEVAKGNKDGAQAVLNYYLGKVVHDGSLPSTGFELNVMPTQGDMFCKMVETVCTELEKGGATITDQCGLHVHVDARDFDYMDIRKLVLLYELCEPAIFACLPQHRHNNHYCQPCGFRYAKHLRAGETLGPSEVAADGKNKYNLKKPVHEMVYGKSGSVTRSGKYGSGEARTVRYMALNLYSYYYRGSVEFRHAPGSINAENITNWALICAGLLDTAMSSGERNIPKMGGDYLKGLIDKGTDLYKAAFAPGAGNREGDSIVEASTALLKECVQERCHPLIARLQDRYQGVRKAKAEKAPPVSGLSAPTLTIEELLNRPLRGIGR